MSDTNVADTFGGGAHRRLSVRPVGSSDENQIIADSEKVVEQLASSLRREVSSINKPEARAAQPTIGQRSPLKAIAQQIKQLVHDDGEQFGDELKAISATKRESGDVSMAKALQLWADETLKDKPTPDTNNK
jgi:ribosomal protein L18